MLESNGMNQAEGKDFHTERSMFGMEASAFT